MNSLVVGAMLTMGLAVCSVASAQQKIWNFTYDSLGRIETKDGPRTDVSDVITYAYNGEGRLASVTNALGHVTSFVNYDAAGRALSVVDPNGVETQFEYNLRGRLTRSVTLVPSGQGDEFETVFDYYPNGDLKHVMSPSIGMLMFEYDAANRLSAISNALGERVEYGLDLAGNQTQSVIRNDAGTIVYSINRVYDELNRVMDVLGNHGQHEHIDYDLNDNPVAFMNAMQAQTRLEHDVFDRVERQIDAGNGETNFTYDHQDRIRTVTNANGATTFYTYDSLDNLLSLESPDTGMTVYAYDGASNRISETNSRGIITYYAYDALNRLTQVSYPSAPAENVSYTYDDASNSNYGVGRLTGVNTSGQQLSWKYDAFGRVVEKVVTMQSQVVTTEYQYGADGLLERIIYPSGRHVNYSRDSQGRIQAVETKVDGSSAQKIVANQYTYLPFGPVKSYQYGNTLSHSYEYDLDYRLTRINVGGVNPLMNRNYFYDVTNNIIGIDNLVDVAKNQSFSYDSLGRIVDAQGVYGQLSYVYDPVGNRLSETRDQATDSYEYDFDSNRLARVQLANGFAEAEDDFEFGARDRVVNDRASERLNDVYDRLRKRLSGTRDQAADSHKTRSESKRVAQTQLENAIRDFQYDAAGNVTHAIGPSGEQQTFGYNVGGRLVTVSINGTLAAEYQYNPLGQRTKKRLVGGGEERYHYDEAGQLITVMDATGRILREYVYDDRQQIGLITPSSLAGSTGAPLLFFVHHDHLGAPQLVTDENQQVVWMVDYEPFGRISQQSTSNVMHLSRFPGQYFDEETGLYYNYFRDYDPALGRYVQSDPIGLSGGINTYAYVGGNPLSFTDPFGLAKLPNDPSGLGDGWSQDHGHRNPNGEKWDHGSGTSIEWHPGQPGKPGWGGKDHWHVDGGKKHLLPGTDVPGFPGNDEGENDGQCGEDSTCRTVATTVVVGGTAYVIYRCVRMIPSLFPPLWPTIPANAAIP